MKPNPIRAWRKRFAGGLEALGPAGVAWRFNISSWKKIWRSVRESNPPLPRERRLS